MKSYLGSLFSVKKVLYKNVSLLAVWDNLSSFDRTSEIRRTAILKKTMVGRYSRVNPGCKLYNTTVGNFTAIGPGSSIGLGTHPTNYVSSQNIFYQRNKMNNEWAKPIPPTDEPISIGSDVWIGAGAMILDGVNIGHGAVVGARSVVTKNVPPYAIVAGVPARIIRYRFTDEIIARLLEIAWWNLDDSVISEKIEFFRNPNVSCELVEEYFGSKS